MENATKALLIAAAVLIAIMLISFGVYIISNTSSTITDNGDLSQQEVTSFNQQFTNYEGPNVTGTRVNGLLKTVYTHNLTAADSSQIVQVVVDSSTVLTGSETVTPARVGTGNTYSVVCNYNNSGRVTSITVTQRV